MSGRGGAGDPGKNKYVDNDLILATQLLDRQGVSFFTGMKRQGQGF
jgi:hypothetical protein